MSSTAVPTSVDEITEEHLTGITGWIGRHALPPTLPHTMPEYSTALALDLIVTAVAAHLTARLPVHEGLEQRNAVRSDWNLLVKAARVWSTEPAYPGWEPIGD